MIYLAEDHGPMNLPGKIFYHKQVLSKEQFFQEGVLE